MIVCVFVEKKLITYYTKTFRKTPMIMQEIFSWLYAPLGSGQQTLHRELLIFVQLLSKIKDCGSGGLWGALHHSMVMPFSLSLLFKHCLRPALLHYRLITWLIIFWVTFCYSRRHILLSFTGISLKFNFVVYKCKDWTSICSFPRKTFSFNPGWRENCDCMTLFICWLASLH